MHIEDVSVRHPLCQIHLLRNHQHPHKPLDDALEGESERSENEKKSGTSSVILDSMMMLWRHIEDVSLGHPLGKIHLLRNHKHPHKLLDDALEGESEKCEKGKKVKNVKT